MATARARTDPAQGRTTVVLAGLLSAAAIIAYTASTARPRAEVGAPDARHGALVGLPELGARAATARDMLDEHQMRALVEEIEGFETTTTLATRAAAAKVELLELHAALALEAAIRATLDPEGGRDATAVANRSITRARQLGLEIGEDTADRGRIDAALARVDLAAGVDITESFPLVLLPSFRDPELRAAAISAPVWRGPEPSDALADGILAQLRATERQTALVRLLTARALAASGEDGAASAKIDDVLSEVPQQPLALALRRSLTVAPTGADPEPTDPAPEPSAAVDAAAPEPEPEPEPAVTQPERVQPKPDAGAKPAQPKPAQPKPDAGTKPRGYDALLADGCKLVRSGKAAEGFDLLKSAFDLNPNAVAVTVCMAEAHHALGRDASARALCDRALRKSPSDRRALLLAAQLELARGNDAAALGHYRKVLENHPDDAKAKAFVEAKGG